MFGKSAWFGLGWKAWRTRAENRELKGGRERERVRWDQVKTEPSFLTRMACSCLIRGSRWNITERSFCQSTTSFSVFCICKYHLTPYSVLLSLPQLGPAFLGLRFFIFIFQFSFSSYFNFAEWESVFLVN